MTKLPLLLTAPSQAPDTRPDYASDTLGLALIQISCVRLSTMHVGCLALNLSMRLTYTGFVDSGPPYGDMSGPMSGA